MTAMPASPFVERKPLVLISARGEGRRQPLESGMQVKWGGEEQKMATDWQPVKEEILILEAATSVVILQHHLSSALEAYCRSNKICAQKHRLHKPILHLSMNIDQAEEKSSNSFQNL